MAPRKKKIAAVVKVQLNAGVATPAPPVGTALGPHGVNIMDFCKQYNAATESQRGNIIPVEITIYEDRSFTFVTKTPPAPELIKKAAGVEKGSGEPHKTKVGTVTTDVRKANIEKAIAAGKHIYTEKPTATSLADALALYRRAKAAGVKHGVVQDKLFLPGLVKMRRLKESGFFGRMLSVKGDFGYWVFPGDGLPARKMAKSKKKGAAHLAGAAQV